MTELPPPVVSLLRNVPIRRFVSALERDGFTWTPGASSHRVYRHVDGRSVVIAYHKGSDTLPRKTLLTFLARTRWNEGDLVRLKLMRG